MTFGDLCLPIYAKEFFNEKIKTLAKPVLDFQIPSDDEADDIEGNQTKHGCRNTPEGNDQQNGQNQDIRKCP